MLILPNQATIKYLITLKVRRSSPSRPAKQRQLGKHPSFARDSAPHDTIRRLSENCKLLILHTKNQSSKTAFMLKSESIDFHSHLPPYRSLLSPNARYDYKTHSLIPISETELNAIHIGRGNSVKATSKIKMKYKSLLSDVSRKTSILSMRIGSTSTIPRSLPPCTFSSLPVEVIDRILLLLDFDDHKSCMLVNKQLYRLTKPHLYRRIRFTSPYRLAQFVTYLRYNPQVGTYVQGIDLSGLKPGVGDSNTEDVFAFFDLSDHEITAAEVLAGWRDWKFLKNPLYSLHSHSNLWKVSSNSVLLNSTKTVNSRRTSSSSSSNPGKFRKLSHSLKYFKPKKSSESSTRKRKIPPVSEVLKLKGQGSHRQQHPRINKFLLEYATLRDIPVGYILHIVNLCPNLISLNLANISLSADYEITSPMVYKYRTVDLMSNYPKDLLSRVNDLMTMPETILAKFDSERPSDPESTFSLFSSASGAANIVKGPMDLVSHTLTSPPNRKYNSLLPPLPQNIFDVSYVKSGDGKVFLSDLNLKSINSNYLTRINEQEILLAISSRYATNCHRKSCRQYLNISSMVWLDLAKVRGFLIALLGSEVELLKSSCEDSENHILGSKKERYKRNLVIDLSNSGMYKVLHWAKVIDFSEPSGVNLAKKIVKGESLDSLEEYIERDRIRRGRIAENYLV